MQTRTQQLLDQLINFPLFCKAGQHFNGNYIYATSWEDAATLCVGDPWSSVQLQVSNKLTREIRRIDYNRSLTWNLITAEIRPKINALTQSISINLKLNTKIQNSLSWDLLMICMETEFSDLVEPHFFVPRLLPIYLAGHFPCGWDGQKIDEGLEVELPDKKLIVY